METEYLKPIKVWEPRCHGFWLDRGVFLIYSRDGDDVLRLESEAVGADPLQVYERLLCDDETINFPQAGGLFSLHQFDFVRPLPKLDLVPGFFRRVFLSPQMGPGHWFHRFRGARILIRSDPTEWGTVDELLGEIRTPQTPIDS